MTKDKRQSGYMLIVVLGTLTVLLILVTGVLPSIAQEVKRERETEMLFRGKQIVQAIQRYQMLMRFRARAGVQQGVIQGFGPWPTSLEELADGITLPGGTQRVRLLRKSALQDPMSRNEPWKLVGRGHPALERFLEAYYESVGQTMTPQVRFLYLGTTVDLGDKEDEQDKREQPGSRASRPAARGRSGRFTLSPISTGPGQEQEGEEPKYVFGVVSGSPEKPMRDYYSLEQYDHWAFVYIPELPSIPPTSDEYIEMLTREIVFPSDPLSLRMSGFGGGGVPFAPTTQFPKAKGGKGKK
jgi:type II secretory pathway pseudopilin PulG